jgi:hypothetical protein
VGVDRPDEDDPRLESVDAHEAHAPDTTGATDGAGVLDAGVLDAGVLDEADAPGERADRPGRLEAHVDLRARADDAYRSHAIDQGCDRVREIEATVVTPAMREIEAKDAHRRLIGLEFRLKGTERLTEKVANAVSEQPDLSYDKAFALVKDAIRYTFEYQEDRYAAGVKADTRRLEDAGFERVDCRNTWANPEYKGVNSRWRAPENGQTFEVQFHTQPSFEAKQVTHAAYERLRDPATTKAEQQRLAEYQREVTARVPVPPGATDIPDYP